MLREAPEVDDPELRLTVNEATIFQRTWAVLRSRHPDLWFGRLSDLPATKGKLDVIFAKALAHPLPPRQREETELFRLMLDLYVPDVDYEVATALLPRAVQYVMNGDVNRINALCNGVTDAQNRAITRAIELIGAMATGRKPTS